MRVTVADPQRLAVLASTDLLDTSPEASFDRLTRLAARVLGAPVVLVSLVDDHRQFFKSQSGLAEPWATRRETPLTHSFCQHVVTSSAPLVVDEATVHPTVRDNLAIPDLGVIAYAGVPVEVDGQAIGAFCAIDVKPRAWSESDVAFLTEIAQSVVTEIELRRAVRDLRQQQAMLGALYEGSAVAIAIADLKGMVVSANPAYQKLVGYDEAELRGRHVTDLSPPEDREEERRTLAQPPSAVPGFHREKRYVRKDGSIFIGRVSNSLIVDAAGVPTHVSGMVIDVTEVKRARVEIEVNAATSAAIVRNLPNGAVLMVDQELRFIAAGGPALPTIMQLVKVDGLIGKTVGEVAAPDSREAMVQIYQDAVDGHEQRLEIVREGRTFEMRTVSVREGEPRALIFLYDISERKAEMESVRRVLGVLERERALFAATLANLQDGVALLDADQKIILANEICGDILALPEVVGLGLADTVPATATLVPNEVLGGEEFLLLKPRRRIVRRTVFPAPLADGMGFVAVWRDVTAARDLAAERERELLTDALTGIPNRRAAERALEVEISRVQRTGSVLCVALLDVDHFKRINDEYGHGVGDEVLRRIATTVAGVARKTDVLARWGGEELLAVLPVGIEGARRFCERARVAVEALEFPGVGPVTLSAGAAQLADGEPIVDTIARADARLYDAKRAGRNRVSA